MKKKIIRLLVSMVAITTLLTGCGEKKPTWTDKLYPIERTLKKRLPLYRFSFGQMI